MQLVSPVCSYFFFSVVEKGITMEYSLYLYPSAMSNFPSHSKAGSARLYRLPKDLNWMHSWGFQINIQHIKLPLLLVFW